MRITVTNPDNLTEQRIKKGLSIRRLAKLANVNPATIFRMEKGVTNPNPATAKAICDALSVDFDKIFTIEGE